jgi:hypothetical protein
MNDAKSDLTQWPQRTPSYAPDERIERRLEIFNDGLAGRDFVLEWEARWDSAQGPVVASGALDDMVIEPGFHKTADLAFTVPR